MSTAHSDLRRARRNVAVLVAAQAILGSQITMVFVLGGLVGLLLAPNPCLATLPITLILVGSATTAPWLSSLMQARGRRLGFLVGASGGLAGSAIALVAVQSGSFMLLLFGSYFTGIYLSAQQFYRFAAVDTAPDPFRPKAIGYVLGGGLIAALIGPQIVSLLSGNSPVATADRYLPVYLAAIAINGVGMGLFAFLDIPKPPPPAEGAVAARTRRQLLSAPGIAVAVICGAVSFSLMNLMMTAAPLAIVGCGFAVPDAANVVSAHVLAMYAPSFFTGHLIARFGAESVVGAGLCLLAMAAGAGISGVDLPNFFIALVLLGLGWNFGYIGATALLTGMHAPEERGRVQGLNDAIVMSSVLVASVASGGLLNCTGRGTPEGWSSIALTMVPFLALAGCALIWLAMRPRRTA